MKQRMSPNFKEKLNRFTSALKKNKTRITITDFGAGSKKLGNTRTVSQIYRTSSSGKKYGRLLYALAAHTQAKNILELGTSLGLGAVMMAEAQPSAKITTIEGCKATFNKAQETFSVFEKENQIKGINASFFDFLKTDQTVYDLVFIDGDHRAESLFKQLLALEKNTHAETLIVLDDIRWSKDMCEAWEQIRKQKRYHLTLDYFRMGVIMQRPHQVKEHFTLRF
ncbi:MAG: O-methyltransferase [Lishizhenia sp.]